MFNSRSILMGCVCFAFIAGCGDDDGDDTGSSNSDFTAADIAAGACEQQDGMAETSDCDFQPYTDCVVTQCAMQYETCLGADYMSGDFSGGQCAEYMQCVMDSDDPCSAPDCTPSQTCTDCRTEEIGACVQSSNCTIPECATGSSTAPSNTVGGVSGGCTELEECCGMLSGEQATQCNDTLDGVMAGGDTACGAALSIYQASSVCQ